MMQRTRSHRSSHYTLFPILISIVLTSLCWSVRTSAADTAQDDAVNYTIYLKSRTFVPSAGLDGATRASLETRRATTETPHLHTLLQLHRIPTDAETQALQQQGIQLLDYIPDNGWLAVVPGDRLTTVEVYPVVWTVLRCC